MQCHHAGGIVLQGNCCADFGAGQGNFAVDDLIAVNRFHSDLNIFGIIKHGVVQVNHVNQIFGFITHFDLRIIAQRKVAVIFAVGDFYRRIGAVFGSGRRFRTDKSTQTVVRRRKAVIRRKIVMVFFAATAAAQGNCGNAAGQKQAADNPGCG